jgi:hypothetical protein
MSGTETTMKMQAEAKNGPLLDWKSWLDTFERRRVTGVSMGRRRSDPPFVRERSRRNEAERTSQDLEQRVSRRAYFLWLEAGRPEGRAEEFWAEAAKQEELGEPPGTDIDGR